MEGWKKDKVFSPFATKTQSLKIKQKGAKLVGQRLYSRVNAGIGKATNNGHFYSTLFR
jgi:hypothetical protein